MSTSDDCAVSTENKRTSANSRVNFSKQTPDEKEQRCANLAKEVKELRRQLKKGGIDAQAKSTPSLNAPSERTSQGIENYTSAQVKLRECSFEIEDQHFLLDNLCKLIVSGRLPTDSFAFNKICTIVRSRLSLEEQNESRTEFNEGENRPQKRILINLPEQELEISEVEHVFYRPFEHSEILLRLLTGAV